MTNHELKLAGALDLAPSIEKYPVRIAERYGHFIDGIFVEGPTDADFTTVNRAPAKAHPR